MTPWLEDPARSLDHRDRPEGLEDPIANAANARVKAQAGTEADASRFVGLLHGLLLVKLLDGSWMLECLAGSCLWVEFLEGLLQGSS